MIRSGKNAADREGAFTLPRRLYLDRDGRVVEADDPSRVTLLGPAGARIPAARARELGLSGVGAPAEAEPAVDATPASPTRPGAPAAPRPRQRPPAAQTTAPQAPATGPAPAAGAQEAEKTEDKQT